MRIFIIMLLAVFAAGCTTTDSGGTGIALRAHFRRSASPSASFSKIAREQALVIANDCEPGVDRRLLSSVEELIGTFDPAPDRSHQPCIEQEMQGNACSRAGSGRAVAQS